MNRDYFAYIKRFGNTYIFLSVIKKIFGEKVVDDFLLRKIRYQNYFRNLSEIDYEKELLDWLKIYGPFIEKNLKTPETFNGKIQWLKLNDNSELKSICADKYKVKEWVKNKCDNVQGVRTLQICDNIDDISFSNLPDKFVIKTNFGCGMNLVIKDKTKIDEKKLKKLFNKWLNSPFGYDGLELQYVNADRLLMVEEYMEQDNGELNDIKIHCFNGEPLLIEYMGERDFKKAHSVKEAWYDTEWNLLSIFEESGNLSNFEDAIIKPNKFDELLEAAKKLSSDFLYVRVDFYVVKNHIYIGEMTFTPCNGVDKWTDPSVDKKLGKLLSLPFDSINKDEKIEIIDSLKLK